MYLMPALSDIAHRKDKLVAAIKIPSRSVALEYAKRLLARLEEGAAIARGALGDESLAAALDDMSKQVKDLPIGETLLVPQGIESLPPKQLEELKINASKDCEELAKLVGSVFIALPVGYEAKPLATEESSVSEPPPEPELPDSRTEVRETVSAEVPEKVENPPPPLEVQIIEKPPDNPKSKDAAAKATAPSVVPAQSRVNPPADLGAAEEGDDLPIEAARFANSARVERIDRRRKPKDEDRSPKIKMKPVPVPAPNEVARPLAGNVRTRGLSPVAGFGTPPNKLHGEAGTLKNELSASSEVFDIKNPEHLREAVRSEAFLGDLMKSAEEGLNRRIKEWLLKKRQEVTEAASLESGPNLEEIIAEVSTTIKRGEGKGLVSVPEEGLALDIRSMARRFGSVIFNKRSPTDKEAEILKAVNSFTSNPNLRADLERVFRRMAKVSKVETKLPDPQPSTGPAIRGTSQYPEPIGPTAPEVTGGTQYPEPIGPKSLRESVVQYNNEPIGPKPPPEGEIQYDESIGPKMPRLISYTPPSESMSDPERGPRRKALKFSDLGTFAPKDLQEILSRAGAAALAKSLIFYTGDIKFLEPLPEAFKAELLAEIKKLPTQSEPDAVTVQESIVKIARDLEAAGVIALPPKPTAETVPAQVVASDANSENALASKAVVRPAIPQSADAQPSVASVTEEKPLVDTGSQTSGAESLPTSPKKETKAEKRNRLARELRKEVLVDKLEEVKKKQSGSGRKPPMQPPDKESGGEPHAETLPESESLRTPESQPKMESVEKTLQVGDLVYYVSMGASMWDEPKPILRIMDDLRSGGKYAFFEGSDIGIPLDRLERADLGKPLGKETVVFDKSAGELSSEATAVSNSLDAQFASVSTLDDLLTHLSSFETIWMEGEERPIKTVTERINEITFFLGDDFFASRDPNVKLSYLDDYLPALDSVGGDDFPELKKALRRVVLNFPSVQEVAGKVMPLILKEKEKTPVSGEDFLPEPEEEKAEDLSTEVPPRPERPSALVSVEEVPIKVIASPSETVARAVLDDPAGFDIGKALDVPGFDEFLAEAEKMGVVVNMADGASLKKRFEAFAFKEAAVAGTYELYADSISKDLGLSLDEEGKQAVREHLERQAHVNPESIEVLAGKLKHFKELPPQIADFERQLNELKAELTPEVQAQAVAKFTTKREAFETVLRTNKFWPGYSEEEGIAGLGRLQHLFGIFSKKSYKGSVARSEVSKISGARSKGFEKYATLGIGGFSNEELRTGLQLVEAQLADFEHQIETKSLAVAELEAQGQLVKDIIENEKVNLFRDNNLTKKLVGMARVKVREKLSSGVFVGEETVEKAVSANELFERTIKASGSSRFGDEGDYLADVDVPLYRKWIDETLDRGIERDIEKAIVRSMALSSGRFGELQKAFDKLTQNERLGSKSRAEVRKFIVKKLKTELQLAADVRVDESTEEGKSRATEAKQKALHLKALIVKQQEALVLNK